MKNFIKYFFAFVALGLSSVYAQKSSIDSPHNYKRPVFQQSKALTESNSVRIFSQPQHQIKNDISSVHNYKRQGLVDFTSEAALVVPISTLPISFNPHLSSNNYKAHFLTTEFGKKLAISRQVKNNIQSTTSINKNQPLSNEAE